MCGIAGILSPNLSSENDTKKIVSSMMEAIQFRGPDDSDIWQDSGVTLGHLRLAIVDLSPAGSQPMISVSGRYVIIYNGEIYNAENIREKLPDNSYFNGHSDTEVILHAIDHWGIEVTVKMLRGMFAFAVYDRETDLLYLVRDPVGIKPLYYSFSNGTLLFASQIKCFLKVPFFEKEICNEALGLYLKYNYVPAPYAIYKNCYKQKSGTILTFKNAKLIKESTYWSLENSYQNGKNTQIHNFQQACDLVEQELLSSIRNQLLADVPVGIFLSGGIDSSLITALACQTNKNIKTFSIGFDEAEYDEAPFAKKIANALGTDHHECYLKIDDGLKIIEDIPKFFDEPFGDASQVPTLLVSQIAKSKVKVALSGDGGDELFFGYSRYQDIETLRCIQSMIPSNLGSQALKGIRRLPLVRDKNAFKCLMAERLFKHYDIESQYDSLFNFWPELQRMLPAPNVKPTLLRGMSSRDYMTYHDMRLYMVDDILTKVDRCSMYCSLETRVPFLDHPMVDLSYRLPMSVKYKDKMLKAVLKNILKKHIDTSLFNRPKKGFALPIDVWLRGSLKDWGYSLINDIKHDGILDYKVVEKYMAEHVSKKMNWQYSLWNIFMWQHWRNYYK